MIIIQKIIFLSTSVSYFIDNPINTQILMKKENNHY